MNLTVQPPTETPNQARARRQIRKAREAMAANPKLDAAHLADERMYQQMLRLNGDD